MKILKWRGIVGNFVNPANSRMATNPTSGTHFMFFYFYFKIISVFAQWELETLCLKSDVIAMQLSRPDDASFDAAFKSLVMID